MQLFEKYRIIERLGNQHRRKFSEVFLVEDKTTSIKYVMKFASIEKQGQVAYDQLLEEQKFNFSFQGLPHIHEVISSEAELIILFDYQEGEVWSEFVKDFSKYEKLQFIKDFTKAIVPLFLHLKENGIVHCDLKESNFIIQKKDDNLSVSLIDFGLAIRTNQTTRRKTLFALGYSAPELILSKLTIINHSTDIYALGIIFWKLLTGKLPLVHPNPSVFTNLQITHPLPEDSSIPKEYFKIIQRMCFKHQFETAPNRMNQNEVETLLEYAQAQRYQSLEEVQLDLEKINVKKSWFSRFLF